MLTSSINRRPLLHHHFIKLRITTTMLLSLALSVGYAAVAAAASSSLSQGAIFVPAGSLKDGGAAPTVLSPSDARLLIAQRLGLSEFHSLADASDAAIDILARDSSSQHPLYATEPETVKRKRLLVIDGESDERLKEFYSGWDRAASLSESPSREKNVKFVEELQSLDRQRQRSAQIDSPISRQKDVTEVFHIDLSSSPALMDDGVDDVKAALDAIDENMEATLLVLPKKTRSNPRSGDWASHDLGKRAKGDKEDIMAAPTRHAVSSTKKPSNFTGHPSATMGRCAATEDDCVARTNNCTGHGSCRLADKSSKIKCWACSCSTTKEEWGHQSWGGPACQKRDISMQFWLFTGFAVAATSLVTWGIGLLYSMGEADLPSVLSAGVAPTTRK